VTFDLSLKNGSKKEKKNTRKPTMECWTLPPIKKSEWPVKREASSGTLQGKSSTLGN